MSGDFFGIEPGAGGGSRQIRDQIYAPDDATDWVVEPDDAGEALDELADRVVTLEAGGAGGAITTVEDTITADGQASLTLGLLHSPNSVFAVVYDGAVLTEDSGYYSFSAPRTINFNFSTLQDAVVQVMYQ